jgi:hypothetical protein
VASDKLSPLQRRILHVLAHCVPPWVLTGGAALAAFHLKQRPTQDVDLFWRDRRQLGPMPREVQELLRGDGLTVETLQSGVTFHRLRVGDGVETCVVDMVAEPVPALDAPIRVALGTDEILVDSRQEILVNKLCALLSRCEIRDLEDVKALLDAGADLPQALKDAPRKDQGFSSLTLAWTLKQLHLQNLAHALSWTAHQTDALKQFHAWLIDRLTAAGAPE